MMSDTMHLICLKDTGHVLAALAATTAGDPPALARVIGEQLHLASVRSTENATDGLAAATTYVPASLLELKSVPLDARVIANPLHHAIDGGRVVRLPPLAAPPAPTLTQSTITLDGGTPDTKGLAVVDRAGDPGVTSCGSRRGSSSIRTRTGSPTRWLCRWRRCRTTRRQASKAPATTTSSWPSEECGLTGPCMYFHERHRHRPVRPAHPAPGRHGTALAR
jgi:hypothetical protein